VPAGHTPQLRFPACPPQYLLHVEMPILFLDTPLVSEIEEVRTAEVLFLVG
jgi:hypothetical protein